MSTTFGQPPADDAPEPAAEPAMGQPEQSAAGHQEAPDPVDRPGAQHRAGVILLAEDATSAQHIAHQWALAHGDADGVATLVHTNRRALRGLPRSVKQVHLGLGPAGSDLAPARRVVAALDTNPLLAKALAGAAVIVAPDGRTAAVDKFVQDRGIEVVGWAAFARDLHERRLAQLLSGHRRGSGRAGLAVLLQQALDSVAGTETAGGRQLLPVIGIAAGGLLDAPGYAFLAGLGSRVAGLSPAARSATGLDAMVRIAELSLGSGPRAGDGEVARAVFDAAADRADQGELGEAVRLLTLGLRLVFHSELHADGERSLLVSDPHTVLAPWRDSRFARELFGGSPLPGRQDGNAGDQQTDDHDAGPAGSAPRPAPGPRIVVLGGAYGSFYQPIVDLLTDAGHRPRLVTADELGPLLGRRDPTEQLVGELLRLRDPERWGALPEDPGAERQLAVLRDRLAGADIIFADWCDPGALFASYLAPPGARLIIRVHRVDATKAWAQLVDWERVERVLLVSDHVRDFFAPQLAPAGSPLPTRLTVVNNVIDVERYRRPKTPGAERRIAMVGWGRRVKDPIFAVEVLRELLHNDPSWRLHLIGRDFPESGLAPVADYLDRFRELTADPVVRDAIVWVGFTTRLEQALDACGFALSTSTVEGWPVGVVEAAVSGCIPVIRDWPQVADRGGARAIYAATPDWVIATPGEAAARIRTYADPAAWAEESARSREAADLLTAAGSTSAEILGLILGTAPRPAPLPRTAREPGSPPTTG